MASKLCSRCNVIKSVNDFNKKAASRDGFQSHCKACNVEINQNWNNTNRDRLNLQKQNLKERNPNVRISNNMHTRLRSILHRGIYSARTEQIIGLSKPLYLEWLSFNFGSEMCWATYGKIWFIDLVIPASAFDLTFEEQLLTCFNWRNIRPCLKNANAIKYNFLCQFAVANQSIRVLVFIRKMRQMRIEHFLQNIE